ncbi:hypothetical protein QCA50_012423 [Cerrena zonata]|uniref:Uncharacterized protein n=1 Tax=Cerrena zonata TaxID=2478898 RepID=A0AAW0FUE6_9APHY
MDYQWPSGQLPFQAPYQPPAPIAYIAPPPGISGPKETPWVRANLTPDTLVPICTYMQGDIVTRAGLLVDIAINITDLPRPVASLHEPVVVAIIQHAVKLKKLVIRSAEKLLRAFPRLVNAISSHPGILGIHFHHAGQTCADMLFAMQSPLTAIIVNEVASVIDWTVSICPFAKTLEHLSLDYTSLDMLAQYPNQTTFTALVSLRLNPVWQSEQKVYRSLASWFPVLRQLTCESGRASNLDPEHIKDCRYTNKNNPPLKKWSVTKISGHAEVLYGLGLDRPVEVLNIWQVQKECGLKCFQKIIEDCPATTFERSGSSVEVFSDLFKLFRNVDHRFEMVDISLEATSKNPPIDPDTFASRAVNLQNYLHRHLRRVKADFLRVNIRANKKDLAEAVRRRIDLTDFSSYLAQEVPSLGKVEIRIAGGGEIKDYIIRSEQYGKEGQWKMQRILDDEHIEEIKTFETGDVSEDDS